MKATWYKDLPIRRGWIPVREGVSLLFCCLWVLAASGENLPAPSASISVSGEKGSGMIMTQKGKEFTITLESNRSTGYLWELTRPVDEAIVTLVKSEYRQTESGLPGAPGSEIWTFVASGAGETEIAMKYVRPWEAGAAPARTAVFKIVVRR